MEKILAIVLGLAIPQAHVLFFLNPFLLGLMMATVIMCVISYGILGQVW